MGLDMSVEGLCNQLAKYRLLGPERVRALRGKWRALAGAEMDRVEAFRQWLTRSGEVTAFQLELLDRGQPELLFFGDYQIRHRIGQGRMAGVYQAEHVCGQKVALKVLPSSKARHAQLLARFVREARLAVRLDHDNVVRTFHHGQTYQGLRYLVMEFLEGETVEDLIQRRGRLAPGEALGILAQALEGLDYLLDVGLVHRDLKPANLMLVPWVGPGRQNSTVKILDIGLGKELFEEGSPGGPEKSALTQVGAMLGPVDYMAPEQARDPRQADIRSDLYSLGCILYEMLTGAPPFPGGHLAGQVGRHAEETARPLKQFLPDLAPEVEQIVHKLMAKDPALRYPTPDQVLKDVRRLLGSVAWPQSKSNRPSRAYLTWLQLQPVEEVGEKSAYVTARRNHFPQAPIPQAAPLAQIVKAAPEAPPPPGKAPSPSSSHPPMGERMKIPLAAFGWSRRDTRIALIGAGALLVIQGLYFLFRWLLS